MMDRAYAGIAHLYGFFGSDDYSRILANKVSAGMYIPDSSKLVLEDGNAGGKADKAMFT